MFDAMLSPKYERRCGGYSTSVISCLHLMSEQKRRCGGHPNLVISCFTHLSLDKATYFTSETKTKSKRLSFRETKEKFQGFAKS